MYPHDVRLSIGKLKLSNHVPQASLLAITIVQLNNGRVVGILFACTLPKRSITLQHIYDIMHTPDIHQHIPWLVKWKWGKDVATFMHFWFANVLKVYLGTWFVDKENKLAFSFFLVQTESTVEAHYGHAMWSQLFISLCCFTWWQNLLWSQLHIFLFLCFYPDMRNLL